MVPSVTFWKQHILHKQFLCIFNKIISNSTMSSQVHITNTLASRLSNELRPLFHQRYSSEEMNLANFLKTKIENCIQGAKQSKKFKCKHTFMFGSSDKSRQNPSFDKLLLDIVFRKSSLKKPICQFSREFYGNFVLNEQCCVVA